MADEHRRQPRPDTLTGEAHHLFRNFTLDSGRNRRPIEDSRHP